MTDTMDDFPTDVTCPCESGKVYGYCCKQTRFLQWSVDEDGPFRPFPLAPCVPGDTTAERLEMFKVDILYVLAFEVTNLYLTCKNVESHTDEEAERWVDALQALKRWREDIQDANCWRAYIDGRTASYKKHVNNPYDIEAQESLYYAWEDGFNFEEAQTLLYNLGGEIPNLIANVLALRPYVDTSSKKCRDILAAIADGVEMIRTILEVDDGDEVDNEVNGPSAQA